MNWLNQLFNKLGQMFNWVFILVPWERALRVRMGKHITILGAGVHFQIPFIDKVFVQNIRTRVAATTAQCLTTPDGVTITLQAALRFEIIDIEPLFQKLHQASNTICQEVEGHFSEYVITHDSSDCTPQKVLDYVSSASNLEQYGLKVTKIFLTDFAKVKTFRLIQGGLDRYTTPALNTSGERRSSDSYDDNDY